METLLLAVILVSLSGNGKHAYIRDVAVSSVWIGAMFFSTGYLFTTGIARTIWQPRRVWLYPMLATLLFLIHFEILNYTAGGIFDPAKRAVIRIAGGCIVLVCTFAGSMALQKRPAGQSRRQGI